jgi:hypothetical protein
MKTLKQLLFTVVFVAGLSTAAMAQKDDQRRPPPKQDPPVINVPDKNRPRENPKNNGGDKGRGGKKPGLAMYFREDRTAV